MATSNPAISTPIPAATDDPRSALRFDAIMIGFYMLFFFGIFLDAWAHAHGQVDNTFFTPWHAGMYGSFTLMALFVGGTMWRGRRSGKAITHTLPRGYETLLLGIGLFGIGGLADLTWHTLFGVETDIEAMFSPSHLILVTSMALILGSPFRAAILRARPQQAVSLWAFLPTLFSMIFLISIIGVMGSPAHPLNLIEMPARQVRQHEMALFAAGTWAHTALIMGIILLAIRTWKLPFGALTLLLVANAAVMCIIGDAFWVLPYIAIAALIAEGALALLKPSAQRPLQFRIAAGVIPLLLYTGIFTAIGLTLGIAWTVHVWTGMIAAAGFIGLLISYLVLPISSDQPV